MEMDLRQTYYERRERIWLFVYTTVMFVSAILIGWMLIRGLEDSATTFSIHRLISLVGLGLTDVAAVALGIHFGFLTLLFIDSRKRTQSVILSLATGFVLTAVGVAGIFVPTLRLIDVLWLVFGLVVGIVLGAGIDGLRELRVADPNTRTSDRFFGEVKFEMAERRLYSLIMGGVIAGFIDAHVDLPVFIRQIDGALVFAPEAFLQMQFVDMGLLAVDIPAIAIFALTLLLFLGYESTHRYFVAGPPRSGKTLFMIGLVKKMKDRNLHTSGGSHYVGLLDTMTSEGDWPATTELPEEQGRGGDTAKIQVTKGRFFPREYLIDAVDYPGELFYFLPIAYLREQRELTISQARHRATQIGNKIGSASWSQFDADEEDVMGDGGTEVDSEEEEATSGSAVRDDVGEFISTESEQAGATDSETTSEQVEDTGTGKTPDTEGDGTYGVFHDRFLAAKDLVSPLENADTLVLVLDMERFVNPEKNMGAEYYSNLLDVVNDKQVIYVAAKADYLLDEFESTRYEGELAWNEKKGPFRRFVNSKLEDNPAVSLILGDEMPYPVFYQTGEDNEELQMVGYDFQVYGFEDVLTRLTR